MTAISLSSFTRRFNQEGEVGVLTLVSPSTMDSADTVDVTEALEGRTLVGVTCWDTTGDDTSTCTVASNVITIDAAGSTTDHVYVITVRMLRL